MVIYQHPFSVALVKHSRKARGSAHAFSVANIRERVVASGNGDITVNAYVLLANGGSGVGPRGRVLEILGNLRWRGADCC